MPQRIAFVLALVGWLLLPASSHADHPADGPQVVHVGALSPSVVVVELIERTVDPRPQIPYEPQPGDEIRQGDRELLGYIDGEMTMVRTGRKVFRNIDGRDRAIGTLSGDGKWLSRSSPITGQRITETTLLEPKAYRVGPAGEVERPHPIAVAVKAKPFETGGGNHPRQITLYLTLAEPMSIGHEYQIDFVGINTRDASHAFTYDSAELRSPAIHASHVGHRPDDPYKRALLSQWTGTGGGFDFSFVDMFELIDEDGRVVFASPVSLVRPADELENLHRKNVFRTDVYELDYSAFDTPGTYRIHVPGVGTSHPIVIDDDVWTEAFRVSLSGLTNHRSGIALPPRIAGYDRPRPMHADDGVKVFQGDVTIFNGESGTMSKSLMRLTNGGTDATGLVEVEGAWGGYMDAGDWDRRSQHLHPTQLLIESYRGNPEFFATLALNVPDEELDNGVPDLIDEILWNVEFFQRLQRDDGGVRGGIESTAHPQNGETSWQESLMLGAFRAEPITSQRFAAAAAATADVLRPFDEAHAEALLADAIRAFDWATDDTDAKLREITSLPGDREPTFDKLRQSYRDAAELAAVELYRATGEQRFHAAFQELTRLTDDNLKATFAYATLPDDLADADLKQAAIDAVVAEADKTLAFGRGNTIGVSHRVPTMPMMGFVGYFTTPESVIGPTLTRAHHLTGDDRYLAAAIRATSYGIGINPTGMTMTTGLGHAWPVEPLHIDSMRLAAPPPPGITVYGTHDPARAPNYIKRWTLPNTIPAWRDWPIAECYFDVGNWVEMNEYTVHQTIGPTANYFAHLASRDQTQPSQ